MEEKTSRRPAAFAGLAAALALGAALGTSTLPALAADAPETGTTGGQTASEQQVANQGQTTGTATSYDAIEKDSLVAQLNQVRASKGLGDLTWSDALAQQAEQSVEVQIAQAAKTATPPTAEATGEQQEGAGAGNETGQADADATQTTETGGQAAVTGVTEGAGEGTETEGSAGGATAAPQASVTAASIVASLANQANAQTPSQLYQQLVSADTTSVGIAQRTVDDVSYAAIVFGGGDQSARPAENGSGTAPQANAKVQGLQQGGADQQQTDQQQTKSSIESVTAPEAISVDAGEDPTKKLPATVTATMSDDSTQSVGVTWDTIDQGSYQGKRGETTSFTVHGTIDGFDQGVDATVNVNPIAATGATVDGDTDVTTTAGTAPTLPETATVTWADGETTDEKIIWNLPGDDAYAAGEAVEVRGTVADQTVTAHVTVQAPETEQEQQPAGAKPHVRHAPAANATAGTGTNEGEQGGTDIPSENGSTAVTASVDPITVESGGKLPDTVTLKLSDGTKVENASVTWDQNDISKIDFNARGGSLGTVTGTATVTDSDNQTQTYSVTADVTVTPAEVSDVTLDGDNVEGNSVDVTTDAGKAPELPTTATVTWSNGEKDTNQQVAWEGIKASLYASAPSSFTVKGTVEEQQPVTANVTVESAVPTIASIDDVTVPTESGKAPDMPEKVSATMSDGSAQDVDVTWDEGDLAKIDYTARDGGTFTVHGTVEGYDEGVDATVTVNPAKPVSAAADGASVSTFAGKAPTLPETATVTWSNGDTSTERVTWDAIDPARYASAGSFDASGTAQGLPVTAHVTVNAVEIQTVPGIQTIVTPAGTDPTSKLPASVEVTMNDGSTQTYAITWEPIDASSYHGTRGQTTSFTVSGMLDGTNRAITANVQVSAPTVASVQSPIEVTTQPGVAPQLPQTVQVTWSNGDVSDEAVTWDAIDPDRYAKSGNRFQVAGRADGWNVVAEVTVGQTDIAQTGDETSMAASVAAAGVGGLTAAAGALLLRLRGRRNGSRG